MKIDANSSNTLNPIAVPVRTSASTKVVDTTSLPAASAEDVVQMSLTQSDTEKAKKVVQSLLAQSDIRPQVIAGRSASDPAVTPSDAQLERLLSALRADV